MNLFCQRLTPALALCMAPIAAALADVADPAQSSPSTPLPAYRSAFADYKPLQGDKPGDWRKLNDTVKGEGMAGMPGMGSKSGHSMPMPMPTEPASAAAPRARAASTAGSAPDPKGMGGMKAMPGMPDMPGHGSHPMPGGKP